MQSVALSKPICLKQCSCERSKLSDTATNSTDTNSSGYSEQSALGCSHIHRVKRRDIVHLNHTHHYNVRKRCSLERKETTSCESYPNRHSDDDDGASDAESSGNSPRTLTYFCEKHDPRQVLQAEQIQPSRVKVRSCRDSGLRSRRLRMNRRGNERQKSKFKYNIAVGESQQEFECRPSVARDMYHTLKEDPKLSTKVHFVETHYLRKGLRGKLKRLCSSKNNVSREIEEVLASLAEIDEVLKHPKYLQTIGANQKSKLFGEITQLLDQIASSSSEPEINTISQFTSKCMCSMYVDCVKRYGEFCASRSTTTLREFSASIRASHIVSESLMVNRGVLAFYSDTVFILDKRNFRVHRGLKQCTIYGFGSQRLFEVIRVSRRHWLFQLHQHGPLFRLSLRKYVDNMVTRHMVYIRRWLPKAELTAHRPSQGKVGECICYVQKIKGKGLKCTLMSEVITQGKVTSAIRMHQPSTSTDAKLKHYVTTSEVSDANCELPEETCSSCLSVPTDTHKHLQWLHVTCGSDVLTYLAIAVSYDLLVRKLSYWKDRSY